MTIAQKIQEVNKVVKCKRLKRTGWVKSQIPDPETVAEHSFRVSLLAMILAPQFKVDQTKVTKMALIHDLGELRLVT